MPNKHVYVKSDNVDEKRVADLYAQAERGIKRVERRFEAITIPSINQLRYAGCHLSRYFLELDHKKELLRSANHCKRAIYDVYETGISYYLIKLDKFTEDYQNVVITDVLPDWVKLFEEIENIREFIIDRQDQEDVSNGSTDQVSDSCSDSDCESSNDRHDYYQTCEDSFDKLRDIFKTATISRSELNKLIKKQRRNIIIFVTSLIGFIILLLGFLGYKDIDSFTSKKDEIKIEISAPQQ